MKLYFDTSGNEVAIGIADTDGNWRAILNRSDIPQRQSKIFFSLLNEVFKTAGIIPAEIKEIIVGIGPGSFTGLRMGLSVAKTWAFARKIPLKTFRSDTLRAASADGGLLIEKAANLNLELVNDLKSLSPIYQNDHFS